MLFSYLLPEFFGFCFDYLAVFVKRNRFKPIESVILECRPISGTITARWIIIRNPAPLFDFEMSDWRTLIVFGFFVIFANGCVHRIERVRPSSDINTLLAQVDFDPDTFFLLFGMGIFADVRITAA